MLNRTRLAVGLLLAVSLASATLPAAQTAKTVLCFGDSITAGKQPASLKPGDCWVDRLQTLSKGAFHCINEGKGGRPANSVEEFKAALKRNPGFDVLILALGTNDARDDGKEGEKLPSRVKKNLGEMVALARAAQPNATILLAGPYNINPAALKKDQPQRDANLRAIAPQVEGLAQEQKTLFVNLYGVVPLESLLTDGVHPDAAGHEKIVQKLWPVLEPIAAKAKQ